MRCIAVINQKGGVGKTTLTANLAHALALAGQSVSVIDLDPQGHLSISLGADRAELGVDAVLAGQDELPTCLQHLRQGFDLLPAGARLAGLERVRESGMDSAKKMRNLIHEHFAGRDIVLIDCPPSSGLLIANALYSADEVLIPVNGDYLALKGLSFMMRTIRRFEGFMGRSLTRWIALNRFVSRRRLAGEVRENLLSHFPGSVLATQVREAAVLAECPGAGRTIFEYRQRSTSANELSGLASDLLLGRTL